MRTVEHETTSSMIATERIAVWWETAGQPRQRLRLERRNVPMPEPDEQEESEPDQQIGLTLPVAHAIAEPPGPSPWASSRTLGFIGLRPSTAGIADDLMVRVLWGMTKRLGFERLIIGNLFSVTDDLAAVDWPHSEANDEELLAIFGEADRIVVGWGAAAPIKRGETVARWARQAGLQPLTLGLTKCGAPKYPLHQRLPRTMAGFEPYFGGRP